MKKLKKIEIHRKSKTSWRLGSYFFNEGINVMSEGQYELVKDHPMLLRQVETGAMMIMIDGKRIGEAEANEVSVLNAQKEAEKKAAQEEKLANDPAMNSTKVGESPLGSLNISEAKELIDAGDNIDDLESWKVGEVRKGVLQAIEDRIATLKREQKGAK